MTFSYLNLAEESYPCIETGTESVDVILCRNVLMYFTLCETERVVAKLRQSLTEGGWLLVGPSETSQHLFSRFRSVTFPGTVLYRKTAQIELPAHTELPAVEPPPSTIHQEPPPQAIQDAGSWARSYADEGNLTKAFEWCEKAIHQDRSNPALHYLLGTILEESGKPEEAVAALRRALYLDHSFVLAHFALGNLNVRLGKHNQAGKNFQNVLSLLSAYQPEEILPESEGMTAGTLMQMVEGELGRRVHAME